MNWRNCISDMVGSHDGSSRNRYHINRAIPHPLPLPELSLTVLLKRDESDVNQTSTYILPSPQDSTYKSSNSKCIASLDHSGDREHEEFSQLTSPSTSNSDISRGIRASFSEITQGVAYHHQMTIPTRSIYGSNGSRIPSPQKRTCVKNPIPSASPLHKNSTSDRIARATAAIVHPLPLPPQVKICTKPNLVPKTPRQSRWKKGKLIGRGTFGSVYVGSNRETGALCAMKEVEILPDDPKSAECIKQLEQEIVVLSKLKHPNIVQYYGSEIVEDRFYIYLEYVYPGSVNKYSRDHCGGMTESIVRNFTRHIVCGLAYLHSTKTIHRDIKGANLLVDANGVVKLADFGMAKHVSGQGQLSMKGSPYWMAPELLQADPQKDGSPDLPLAIDIWSLGCTIIEMMTGKPPWSEFEGPAALFKVMKENPPIPETMSVDGKDFLRCCFIRNPAERPTATMLLEHRFLNNSSHLDVSTTTSSLNRMTLMLKRTLKITET